MKDKKGVLILFNNVVQATEKMADYLWQKQQVTLNNIANQSTPGYKSQFVTFDEELKNNFDSQLVKSSAGYNDAIKNTNIQIHTNTYESNGIDGNNVQSDIEQLELASTSIQYQYTLTQLNSEFQKLRTVIK